MLTFQCYHGLPLPCFDAQARCICYRGARGGSTHHPTAGYRCCSELCAARLTSAMFSFSCRRAWPSTDFAAVTNARFFWALLDGLCKCVRVGQSCNGGDNGGCSDVGGGQMASSRARCSGGAGFRLLHPARTESSAPSPSPASRSFSCADRPEREVAVVICHTGLRCSRSCDRLRRSLSRILNTSSSLGSVNGLRSASSQFPAIVSGSALVYRSAVPLVRLVVARQTVLYSLFGCPPSTASAASSSVKS